MIWEASSTLNTDFLHTLKLGCEAQMCEGNVVQSTVRFGSANVGSGGGGSLYICAAILVQQDMIFSETDILIHKWVVTSVQGFSNIQYRLFAHLVI
jgi:hypothetical protein